jgi:hypothetical protein
MLKSVLARVSFINLKFFFLKDPTDVMDEDIAKKLSTLSPLINTNGPLLCRQKIHIENQMHPKHYHGQWHYCT